MKFKPGDILYHITSASSKYKVLAASGGRYDLYSFGSKNTLSDMAEKVVEDQLMLHVDSIIDKLLEKYS